MDAWFSVCLGRCLQSRGRWVAILESTEEIIWGVKKVYIRQKRIFILGKAKGKK